MNNFELTGKNALVTGGAGGLGRGAVEGLLEAGANVVILDISAKLTDTIETLSLKDYIGFVKGIRCDLGKSGCRKDGFGEAMKLFGGKLDILINCAGIQRRSPAAEFSMEDWNTVIEVNLTAVFELCQLAGKAMLDRGSGKIINFASMLSFFGGFTVPAYAASKGGVAQITKSFSNEWAGRGVNVNAIAPGYMATEMNSALISDELRNTKILGRIPAGRWGSADDIKGIIVFLSSRASDYINGAIIPVDGGYLGN